MEGLGWLGEVSWEFRRRLEGEKVTVAETLGGGVGGLGCKDSDGGGGGGEGEEVEVEAEGVWVWVWVWGWGLGAKKREMTCCFCFPMAVVVVVDLHCCCGRTLLRLVLLGCFGALAVFSNCNEDL